MNELGNKRWRAIWRRLARRPETEALRPMYAALVGTDASAPLPDTSGLNETDQETFGRHVTNAYARVAGSMPSDEKQQRRVNASRDWWDRLKEDPERHRAFVEDRRLKAIAGLRRKRGA